MTISPIFEISGYATYFLPTSSTSICQLLHLCCHVVHQGLYLYEHPSSDNASPLVPEALRSSSSHEGTRVVCFDLLQMCSEGICASVTLTLTKNSIKTPHRKRAMSPLRSLTAKILSWRTSSHLRYSSS